jgi:hypothetical protein
MEKLYGWKGWSGKGYRISMGGISAEHVSKIWADRSGGWHTLSFSPLDTLVMDLMSFLYASANFMFLVSLRLWSSASWSPFLEKDKLAFLDIFRRR